jgi:hypothetical protein
MRILLAAAVVLVMALPAFSQVETYGLISAGTMMTGGGQSHFALFAGANTPVYRDTARHFASYNRTGYYYSKNGGVDEVQALNSWLFNSKYWNLGKTELYFGLGGGILQEIEGEGDKTYAGFKAEIGAGVWGLLSFAIGADYYPTSGSDRSFLYGSVELLP